MSERGPAPAPGEAQAAAGDEPGGWLQAHAAGDPEAFPLLVAAYRRPVYSWLVRCGVEPADRDDLFQSIFLRLHRAAPQYRPERPAHPWIFTVVANEVRRHLRRRRIRELVMATPIEADPPADAPDSQRSAEALETLGWLAAQLPLLPLAQREALLMVSVQGCSLSDAAAALGRPLNTIKTHLRRARATLAERLARHRGEEVP